MTDYWIASMKKAVITLFGFGFLIFFWTHQLFWRADLTELVEVAPVPWCLPCTFAIPGAGTAEMMSACAVPSQSIQICNHMAAVVSSPPVHTGLHCCRNGDTCQCLCQRSSGASPALEIPCELPVSYVQPCSFWWSWSFCSRTLLYCPFDPSPGFLVHILLILALSSF